MKIGFLVLNPMSGILGYSIRQSELTKHLSQLGIEVHVFSPFESDAKTSNTLHYHNLPSLASNLGITDIAYQYARKATKSRVFVNFFLYREKVLRWICAGLAKNILPLIAKTKVDILHGDGSIPTAALLLTKKELKIPVVFDYPDLWAEEEVLAGRIREGGSVFRVLRVFIQEVVNGSDIVLVANEKVKQHMIEVYGVNQAKIGVCLNAGEIRPETRSSVSEIPRIIYAGNFERYEYVDLFIKSLPYLRKHIPLMEPIIIGKGPEEDKLKKLASLVGFKDIFKGPKSRDEAFKLCATCDVGVVPTKKSFSTPIKLFDYLSVGLPVVTIRGMWWSKIVEQYQVGITADFDPECYAKAIVNLLHSPELEKYGRNAKNLILKKYNWSHVAKKLSRIYEKLV